MSDTPRTKKQTIAIGSERFVPAIFARQLERESRAMRTLLIRLWAARVAMNESAVIAALDDVDRYCREENTN